MLPHLTSGWAVDQAIVSEEDRVVVIRFGHDWDPTCMLQDEVLYKIAEDVKNFAVIYLVDITEVSDFNAMYELYDPCTIMFFFRNKHMMVDLGTGNNNKINFYLKDKEELTEIIQAVFKGARKGMCSALTVDRALSAMLSLVFPIGDRGRVVADCVLVADCLYCILFTMPLYRIITVYMYCSIQVAVWWCPRRTTRPSGSTDQSLPCNHALQRCGPPILVQLGAEITGLTLAARLYSLRTVLKPW